MLLVKVTCCLRDRNVHAVYSWRIVAVIREIVILAVACGNKGAMLSAERPEERAGRRDTLVRMIYGVRIMASAASSGPSGHDVFSVRRQGKIAVIRLDKSAVQAARVNGVGLLVPEMGYRMTTTIVIGNQEIAASAVYPVFRPSCYLVERAREGLYCR